MWEIFEFCKLPYEDRNETEVIDREHDDDISDDDSEYSVRNTSLEMT